MNLQFLKVIIFGLIMAFSVGKSISQNSFFKVGVDLTYPIMNRWIDKKLPGAGVEVLWNYQLGRYSNLATGVSFFNRRIEENMRNWRTGKWNDHEITIYELGIPIELHMLSDTIRDKYRVFYAGGFNIGYILFSRAKIVISDTEIDRGPVEVHYRNRLPVFGNLQMGVVFLRKRKKDISLSIQFLPNLLNTDLLYEGRTGFEQDNVWHDTGMLMLNAGIILK